MLLKAVTVCCAVLVICLGQSEAQIGDTAASLSNAPVGLYSRTNIFGDSESAASLSGAPVGLYNKRHYPRQFPQLIPIPFPYPQIFKYPIYSQRPPVYGQRPPGLPIRPPRPPRPPPKPMPRPPGKPGTGLNPRLLGGLPGGLLGGLFGGLL